MVSTKSTGFSFAPAKFNQYGKVANMAAIGKKFNASSSQKLIKESRKLNTQAKNVMKKIKAKNLLAVKKVKSAAANAKNANKEYVAGNVKKGRMFEKKAKKDINTAKNAVKEGTTMKNGILKKLQNLKKKLQTEKKNLTRMKNMNNNANIMNNNANANA